MPDRLEAPVHHDRGAQDELAAHGIQDRILKQVEPGLVLTALDRLVVQDAFQGLGEGAVTTIQAVAPGISEALVATAAGLFAAIPAVIAYNHFVNRLKLFGVEMDDFSSEFLNTIERSF